MRWLLGLVPIIKAEKCDCGDLQVLFKEQQIRIAVLERNQNELIGWAEDVQKQSCQKIFKMQKSM